MIVNRILAINVSVTTSVTTVYFHYQELSGDGKINAFPSELRKYPFPLNLEDFCCSTIELSVTLIAEEFMCICICQCGCVIS